MCSSRLHTTLRHVPPEGNAIDKATPSQPGALHPRHHTGTGTPSLKVITDLALPMFSDETARRYLTERAQSSLFPIFG
ncbi:hypothetical protein E2C01_011611 [Portunus trituberculatus]|uniref:Uncharacterized protein n=1 Tax=Portunus trituberculatus TaxID=210409 RepID=A0A5B7DBW7_PORTR|nr:hypothetical protein [Portunus trituberculatus]